MSGIKVLCEMCGEQKHAGRCVEEPAQISPAMQPTASNDGAVAEAVKGLCVAKVELIKARDRLRDDGMWMRFDDIWKQYTSEIAATDARLDALMMGRSGTTEVGKVQG